MAHQNIKIVAIIQARMGSSRLPGKVMLDLTGEPMLARAVNRTLRAKTLNAVVVATTTVSADDAIVSLCADRGWPFFRGSEDDVLDRYYQAASAFQADVIVRITSDCPLVDPKVIDMVVDKHLTFESDYSSTTINWGFGRSERTLPLGLDVEAFNWGSLERANKEAKARYEREHVTPYIYLHPEIFKVQVVEASEKLRRPDLRLTVDTKEDLELVREIYQRMYRETQVFYTEDVIDLLDKHPQLKDINTHIKQKRLGE